MTMIYGELKLRGLMFCLPGIVVCCLRGFVDFLSSGHTVLFYLPADVVGSYSPRSLLAHFVSFNIVHRYC